MPFCLVLIYKLVFMTKRICIYSFLLIFALFMNSCTKESLRSEKTTIPNSFMPVTEYDKDLANIALALHQSLNDNQFTKTLRNEIMQRPDGDYEVILKSLVNRNISFNKTPLFTSLGNNRLKGSGDGPNFLEKYPKLQIAIPVNAEKWDGSSNLWILYLPSNYKEFSTKEVPAISPEGKSTMFNIEKQPDFPVIVIGQNERSNENGDLKFCYDLLHEKVKLNPLSLHSKDDGGFTSFSATPVQNAMAVSLFWNLNYPSELEPFDHYFEIYRDDLKGSGFQKIGEAESWQSFYYDYDNILPSSTYAYYVVARVDNEQTYNHDYYNFLFYSIADEAAIPQIPNFASNLSVDCIAPNTMRLVWTINNTSNWTNLRIERFTAYNPIPVVVAELPVTAINYTDYLASPYPSYGVSYRYNLVVYNVNNNAQQAYYCDEMLSNRISAQQLKLTHVQFNTFDDMRRYESWILGAPEVMLSVNTVLNNNPQNIINNSNIGSSTATTGWDWDKDICQWITTDSKVFTISLNEDDGGGWAPIEVNLGNTVKATLPMGIELSKTFNIKTTIPNWDKDDFIGTGYLYWWDNADGKDVQCGSFCKVTLKSVQN